MAIYTGGKKQSTSRNIPYGHKSHTPYWAHNSEDEGKVFHALVSLSMKHKSTVSNAQIIVEMINLHLDPPSNFEECMLGLQDLGVVEVKGYKSFDLEKWKINTKALNIQRLRDIEDVVSEDLVSFSNLEDIRKKRYSIPYKGTKAYVSLANDKAFVYAQILQARIQSGYGTVETRQLYRKMSNAYARNLNDILLSTKEMEVLQDAQSTVFSDNYYQPGYFDQQADGISMDFRGSRRWDITHARGLKSTPYKKEGLNSISSFRKQYPHYAKKLSALAEEYTGGSRDTEHRVQAIFSKIPESEGSIPERFFNSEVNKFEHKAYKREMASRNLEKESLASSNTYPLTQSYQIKKVS